MLPSHSGIIAGAIYNGENTLLHRGIETGLTQWELATTTIVLPTWHCQIIDLRINLIPQTQYKTDLEHISLPSFFSVPPCPGI